MLKNAAFYLLSIVFLLSCNNETEYEKSLDLTSDKTVSIRKNDLVVNQNLYLVKNYSEIFAIFHIKTGSYLWYKKEFNTPIVCEDFYFEGSVVIDEINKVVYINSGQFLEKLKFNTTYFDDSAKKILEKKGLWATSLLSSSYGFEHNSANYSDATWVPTTGGGVVSELSCECIKGSGKDSDCDYGGEGSTGCSAGVEGGVSVLGNGGNGGKTCGVNCKEGYYACCNSIAIGDDM